MKGISLPRDLSTYHKLDVFGKKEMSDHVKNLAVGI